jgi:hypothetical protein
MLTRLFLALFIALTLFSRSGAQEKFAADTVLAGFVAAESRARQVLNQYTFKRDVLLQTVGVDGQITGEYLRNSQFLFDDRGNRIERVLFHPPSTIREMRITKEDIQDLAGAQLLGVDIFEAGKYQLSFLGETRVESRPAWVIEVRPSQTPNPHRMRERFFVGTVWTDRSTFQVIKVQGTVEPQGKQRFPRFETHREILNDSVFFPSRTQADDVLSFPERDVHYRITVRYYDYRRFASQVSVKEVDEPSDQ